MDILPGSGHPAGGLLPTLGDNALNERPPVMRAYAADRETPAFVPHRQGRFLAGTARNIPPSGNSTGSTPWERSASANGRAGTLKGSSAKRVPG
jgi:hypothetical protein